MKKLIVSVIFLIFIVSYTFGQVVTRQITSEQEIIQHWLPRILEDARSDTYEKKMDSLEIIKDVLASIDVLKITNIEIIQTLIRTLEYLYRNNNHISIIRRESAKLLGLIATDEAKNLLIRILGRENEPMVIFSAISSLGDIGICTNGETTTSIAQAFTRVHNERPDNLVAVSAIEALGKIVRKNNYAQVSGVQVLRRIMEGNYLNNVKDLARQEYAFWRTLPSQ